MNNYDDNYYGVESLRTATTTSDNSVFAELGLKVGTRRIARMARRMGIRTHDLHQPGDDARRPSRRA